MFELDPSTIMAAVLITCVAMSVVLVVAMIVMGDFSSRCKARHLGQRCVYERNHSGAHCDEHSLHWEKP